jgi:hypothetical protein
VEFNKIPEEYHEFANVFSKSKANTLTEHHPYDLKINLHLQVLCIHTLWLETLCKLEHLRNETMCKICMGTKIQTPASHDIFLLVTIPTHYNTHEADDSNALLDLHHLKNKSSKPPNPEALLNSRTLSRHPLTSPEGHTVSHHTHHAQDPDLANRPKPKHTCHHMNTPSAQVPHPHHADDSHHAKTRDPNPSFPECQDARQVPNSKASESEENSSTKSDSESLGVHGPCNSKSQKEPSASQLGFYEGHTAIILNTAKYYQRFAIHVNEPSQSAT